MRDLDQELARLASCQHGIFTGKHARSIGLSERQIDHRIRTGQWRRLFNYAFHIGGAPVTWKGLLLAACWAGGFRAVASHRSAAALYGWAGGREAIAEIMCPRWRRARHRQVEVHETKVLEALDVSFVEGIPVTTPERTLLDLGAVCSPTVVLMALDRARNTGQVTFESKLRWALSVRDPRQAPSESEMETLMLEVLRRHGLPAPIPQYEIRDRGRFVARVDAAYPDARLAIEYQSYQEHMGPEPLVRDNRRRSRLRALRWEMLGVTHPELKDGGDSFCAAIRAVLRDAA
jgi:hypothetical protein